MCFCGLNLADDNLNKLCGCLFSLSAVTGCDKNVMFPWNECHLGKRTFETLCT